MQYLLNVSYKGTNYAGWQRQENAVSVQQKIEEALAVLYKQPISITGASRTDAGVHALGQKCCFRVDNQNIPVDKLPYAINSQLPSDISVTWAKVVEDSFHPIFDAKNKTYIYRIYNNEFRNPMIVDVAWHVYYMLNVEDMAYAALSYEGIHDFSAFCAAGGSAKTHERTIYSSKVYVENDIICFEVNGSGFLYNMVRIMAGTLMYAGCGKIGRDNIGGIIASKDRQNAGITAPPQGLCLKEVYYE